MAKFAFYIINLDEGVVTGTNSNDVAAVYQDGGEASNFLLLSAHSGTYDSAAVDDEEVREHSSDEEEEDLDD